MIHNNNVLNRAIKTAEKFTEKYNNVELYIIQNVYGKIIVYADTLQKEIIVELEENLKSAIDAWLNTCELIEDNFFAKKEIEIWKQESKPVGKRVWVFEKVYYECVLGRKKEETREVCFIQ